MKMRISTFLFTCVAFWGVSSNAFAQSSGDYVAIADGDYNGTTVWGIADGLGNFPAAGAAPTTAVNVWIPAGRTLTCNVSTANAKDLHIAGTLTAGVNTTTTKDVVVKGNLTIESTGILTSTSVNAGNVGTLTVGGNLSTGPCTLQVDGQLGSASATTTAGSGFRLYVEAGGTTTVQGNGKFNIARFQVSSANTRSQTIVIDMDMNLLNSANNGKTLSLENGNAGTATKTLVINAGRTVTFSSNSSNSVLHGQTNTLYPTTTGGNITYDIQGTLNTGTGGGLWLNTTSNASSTTQTVTLKIGATGKLILGTKVNTDVNQPATQNIVYDFSAGSTVEYSGATVVAFTGTNQKYMNSFSNLIMNNTGGLTLPVATTTNNLTLTAGTISLGTNNLTVAGAITGGSSSSFIVTDGTGVVSAPVAASTTTNFPIGPSTTAFAPVSVNPASATTYAASVSTTHAGSAPSGYNLNAEEWKLTPALASSTVVSLTPSVATYNGGTAVFNWNGASYDVLIGSTYNGGTYTATTSTFTNSFATGGSGTTAIKYAAYDAVSVYSDGSQLIVSNAKAGDLVNVYTVSGGQVAAITLADNQTAIDLASGIYIVNVQSSEAIKVAKVIVK